MESVSTSQVVRIARGRRRWRWIEIGVALTIAMLMAGCGAISRGVGQPFTLTGGKAAPTTLTLSPGSKPTEVVLNHKDLHLSKSKHEAVQWQNKTSEDLMLEFIDSGGKSFISVWVFVPKNNSTSWFGVCEGCDTKFPSSYKVKHWVNGPGGGWQNMDVSGPPGDPQVVVDE
jgi:hypothetical protein